MKYGIILVKNTYLKPYEIGKDRKLEAKIEKKFYTVTAIDLTHDALGVTRLPDGYTVFVEDLLKGERAVIEITF